MKHPEGLPQKDTRQHGGEDRCQVHEDGRPGRADFMHTVIPESVGQNARENGEIQQGQSCAPRQIKTTCEEKQIGEVKRQYHQGTQKYLGGQEGQGRQRHRLASQQDRKQPPAEDRRHHDQVPWLCLQAGEYRNVAPRHDGDNPDDGQGDTEGLDGPGPVAEQNPGQQCHEDRNGGVDQGDVGGRGGGCREVE